MIAADFPDQARTRGVRRSHKVSCHKFLQYRLGEPDAPSDVRLDSEVRVMTEPERSKNDIVAQLRILSTNLRRRRFIRQWQISFTLNLAGMITAEVWLALARSVAQKREIQVNCFAAAAHSLCTFSWKSSCARTVQECIVFNRFELTLSFCHPCGVVV